MKHLHSILLIAATLGFSTPSYAQTAQKPKPLSSSDTRAYVTTAESLQYQMGMSMRLRGKFKETDPALVGFGSKLNKEVTDLYTPGVNLAQSRGVDGKSIPQGMSKTDAASVAKLNAIKDDKKWTLAYFETFAKDSKKNALDAEKTLKGVMDPELKAWVETVVPVLKTQSATIDAKYQELKSAK
jgi:hypothetical protein